MPSTDDRMDEQLRYYRARAAEYDVSSYGVLTAERDSVPHIVDRLAPTGDVLELACGTGVWTVELARHATTLTAVDGAPEMLALAEERLAGSDVQFIRSDIFQWSPTTTYDVVFFAAWLSHVPPELFEEFWSIVARALKPGGRVLVLDELPVRAVHETFVADQVASRTLADGSQHRIVKIFFDPAELAEQLTALGWNASVRPVEHGWFVCEATRSV
jgi:demethylmenaquinone methyltransferase/2-methoxy-6-polyprenyl-1,4-benzoquinol methylase